jgi:hypothetical protein
MLILICKGGVKLINVNERRVRVVMKEEELVVHRCKQDIVHFVSVLKGLMSLIEELDVLIVDILGKLELFLWLRFLEKTECTLAQTGPCYTLLLLVLLLSL